MKTTSFLLAGSLTVLFVATACAQSDPAATPPPSSNPSSTVPQTTPPPQQNTDPRSGTTSQRDQQNPTGSTMGNQDAGTPPPFDQLDATRSGYLNREAANGNPWLTRNFQRCDTDHDMRVSRAEYEACVHSPTR